MAGMRQALRFTVALVAGSGAADLGGLRPGRAARRAPGSRSDMQLRVAAGRERRARDACCPTGIAGQERGLRKRPARADARRAHHGGRPPAARTARPARRTADYPAALSCRSSAAAPAPRPSARRRRPGRRGPPRSAAGRAACTPRPSRCSTASEPLGFVVLVHDLSFVERREATTRRFLLLAFGVLALGGLGDHRRGGAPVVAGLEQRAARAWSGASGRRPSSSPSCATCASWWSASPRSERPTGWAACGRRSGSRRTLSRHLHGERVVIVANREPYIHERTSRRRRRRACIPRAAWSRRSSR